MGVYFPIFISLEGRQAAVIGAGKIAARRAGVLRGFGCGVTVIAPEAGDDMRSLLCRDEEADEGVGDVCWVQENFSEQRLDELHQEKGFVFLVAACDDREANRRAGQEAKRLGIPANVADCRDECDFYFPGIAKKDNVVVGVCASGENHRLARQATEKMRTALDEIGKQQ